LLVLGACGGGVTVADAVPPAPDAGPLGATVLVAEGGALVAHDPAGGGVRGRIAGVEGVTALARLDETAVAATLGAGTLVIADARRLVATAACPRRRAARPGPVASWSRRRGRAGASVWRC